MNKNNNWCVYMHINKFNNKKYIGITCNKPKYRWNYGRGYKNNPHFWNSIQKYGWDNFGHIIVLQNETHDYACEVEKCLIKHYKTMNPMYGYNHTSGGDSGFRHTEETKQKISEANKGAKNVNYKVSPKDRMDAETYKQWLHKQQHNKPTGSDNPMFGVTPKERMSAEVYEQWLYKQQHNKPTGKDHPMYGVSPQERMDEETYQQWLESIKNTSQNIAVKCIETGEKYISARDAERKTGIGHSSIIKSCISENHSTIAGGFHWCYADDDLTLEDLGIEYKGKRYILCVETGKIYKTAREVKRELGCDDSAINKCCKGYGHKTVYGYHWEYIYLLPDQYKEWLVNNRECSA